MQSLPDRESLLNTIAHLAATAIRCNTRMQAPGARSVAGVATLVRYAHMQRMWMNSASFGVSSLALVLVGQKELIRDRGSWTVPPGHAVWIPAGHYDSMVNLPHNDQYEAVAVEFEPEVLARTRSWLSLRSSADQTLRTPCVSVADEALLHAFVHLLQGILSNETHGELLRHRVEEVLLAFVVGATRANVRTVASRVEVDLSTSLRQLVAARPDNEWKLSELATQSGLSESTLRRRLSEAGTTAGRLVREERLRLARDLLQDPRVTVEQVAMRCGYGSTSHFAKQFRALHGVAPREATHKRS